MFASLTNADNCCECWLVISCSEGLDRLALLDTCVWEWNVSSTVHFDMMHASVTADSTWFSWDAFVIAFPETIYWHHVLRIIIQASWPSAEFWFLAPWFDFLRFPFSSRCTTRSCHMHGARGLWTAPLSCGWIESQGNWTFVFSLFFNSCQLTSFFYRSISSMLEISNGLANTDASS